MELEIYADTVTPLQVNAYLAFDPGSRDAVLIDPGEFSERLDEHIQSEGLKVRYVLNTHGHFDHIGGNALSSRKYDAPIVCHLLDAPLLEDLVLNGSTTFALPIEPSQADRKVEDGDVLTAGTLTIQVLHTPGHTPGGACYLIGGTLFSGDTLFAGGVGNYEFPGGSRDALMRSIQDKLFTLPGETRVFPGHGPQTTIEREMRSNPYFVAL